jgi:4-amino-4-deoxy-L-arabinose transferase-like glycosyltransferase
MQDDHLTRFGWLALWLATVLCALLCRPPMPIDETRYLSVAWEMWQHNQWLVPHSNGLPYSHKPPLLFWLIHLGWSMVGVNEWTARLTAPLFGLATILLAQQLARLLWPEHRRLREALPYLLLGTCFWSLYATLTMFDLLVSCFALMAWIATWRLGRQRTWSGWLLYGAATGLGLLAKGPVILLYVLPPALVAPWWTDSETRPSWPAWYSCLTAAVLLGLLMALAWALPAARSGGEEYAQAILLGQTTGRILHAFAHQRPLYWYLVFLPLLFFPWSLHLPILASMRAWRPTSPSKYCLSIIVPAFLLLSLISSKQAHYLLPLFPPTLLLLNHGALHADRPKPIHRWLVAASFLILALFLGTARLLPSGGETALISTIPSWLGLAPLLAAGLVLRPKDDTCRSVVTIGLVSTGLLVSLHLGLRPQLHMVYGLADIGQAMAAADRDNRPILVYPPHLDDQFQFAGRLTRPVDVVSSLAESRSWCRRHPQGLVILFMNRKYLPSLPAHLTHPYKNRWLTTIAASSLASSEG